MSIVLWGVLALVGGFFVLWIVARRARPSGAPLPPDTDFPATPLQRVSRWSLALGLLLALAAAALVVVSGAEATFESDALRLTFTTLLLGVLGILAAASIWLKGQVVRPDGALDERDKAILGRAPAMQAAAMMVTLAIWIIGLAEHFHDVGAVPVFYLYLVFWSCAVVNLLGLPVGVLVEYRRG
jgi:hypothetical protein